MKKNIHPEYRPVIFKDAGTGKTYKIASTIQTQQTVVWEDGNVYPLVMVEVSADSHPFYTGKQRTAQLEGQINKFNRKYGLSE